MSRFEPFRNIVEGIIDSQLEQIPLGYGINARHVKEVATQAYGAITSARGSRRGSNSWTGGVSDSWDMPENANPNTDEVATQQRTGRPPALTRGGENWTTNERSIDQAMGGNTSQGESAPRREGNEVRNNLISQNNSATSITKAPGMAGQGHGNPEKSFKALGSQAAGDTFDVGFIEAGQFIKPATTHRFKTFKTSHGSFTLASDPYSSRNVFQIAGYSPAITPTSVTRHRLNKFITIDLNTPQRPVKLLGHPTFLPAIGGNDTHRPLNGATTYPDGWARIAKDYRHYKVKSTSITFRFRHIGDSSSNANGMPVKLVARRFNKHNASELTNFISSTCYENAMEHPEYFEISDWLFPNSTTTYADSMVEDVKSTMKGTNYSTYTYNYKDTDATTVVDLDGDTANQSMWSLINADPPERQVLEIYAIPMYAIQGTKGAGVNDYKDAAISCEIMIDQIVQFRDWVYTRDMGWPDTATTGGNP